MFKKIIKNRILLSILLSLFVMFLVILLSKTEILYFQNKKIQNVLYSIKNDFNNTKVSKDIVIVEIDNKTLEDGRLWRFPFDRADYAPVIKNLKDAWALVIWFDIIFTEKTNPKSDNIFRNSIKDAWNVIIGSYFTTDKDNKKIRIFKKSYFSDVILSTWFFTPKIDKLNHVVYSLYPFWKTTDWKVFNHFSIDVLKAYYWLLYNKDFLSLKQKIDNEFYYVTPTKPVPLARKWTHELLINYVKNNDFTKNGNVFSFIDIYDKNKFNNIKEFTSFKDKIVLIWTTAQWIKDIFYTPNGIEPWVYVHANMINTILTKNYLQYFNKNLEYILLFLLILLSIYFNLSRSWYVLLFSNIAIIFIFLFIFPLIVILKTFLILNFPIELLVWLILSLALSNTVKYLIENKNKDKLNKALSEYVSKDVAKEILSWEWKLNLDWENKHIAIFFSDIEWFTSMSEKFSPEELVWFLREYLGSMSDIIMDEKWFINKYEWDAIMALWWVFWEDKNKSYNICVSALKQQSTLKELNKLWSKRWFSEIKARIGMHMWNAIIWNIWSKWRKMEFTALWDSVNLASRLEWVNKFYWTYICASEDIYEAEKENFEFRYLDRIKVKWKEIPIKIYELLWIKWEVSNEKLEIKELFEKATKLYLSRNFNEAKDRFITLVNKWDDAWKIYLDMCEIYIKNPPWDDWDGVAIMTQK